ncbi:MAG: DUF4340 domain-containing protein [Verrucomicrobia bacterium]|nr:DUF4340 domain-containing protein [Verrucomicrobiota bacterium]
MKLKTLVLTIAVLAVLAAVAFIARRPEAPPAADARLNQSLVDRATVEKAAKLRIADSGKTIELVRQSDGTWRVPSYYDMPADFNKLSGFVGNLTEAKLQRLVTSNPERINRLEFKDTKIDLLDGSDKVLFTVTLGKNPETGSGRFVRFGDEKKAYLASLSAWLDTEARNWANAELTNLKPDDIAKVELPFAEGGPITVSRAKKEDAWTADKTPAGQKVKADKIASLLSTIGTVRFTDTSGLDDANVAVAKANLRTFKVTTFDNKTVTIAMGRKPEEKKLKPPTPGTDGKSGPAALGSVSDLAKKEEKKDEAKPGEEKKEDKPLAPEFETIPAGPVYAFIAHSESSAPINALMQKRAFQIAEYTFTGLPQKADEIFEPAPPPPPPPAANPAPAEKKEEPKAPAPKK